jgi:methionyl-tRNA formyltransferase
MRIVFCGSGSLAVPSLWQVPAAGHQVAGVVTQPARPAGRGGRLRATPVAEAARAAGMEILETPKINSPDSIAWIARRAPDVLVVIDFGQMIRQAARSAARLDAINLHASMLPDLRGAAPVNWAILRGYTKTGISTFSLLDKLDAGPIYVQEELDIRPEETAEELRARCAEAGAAAVLLTLRAIEAGVRPSPQDESRVTLAPLLHKSDGIIDWTEPARAIRNRVHGAWPWPGGQATFRRRHGPEAQVILARAAAEARRPATFDGPEKDGGDLAGILDGDLCAVAGGGGRVRVLQIKPAGGRLMDWRDFVNGYRAMPGDRFVRPGDGKE